MHNLYLVLHFYQTPTQSLDIIDRVVKESYIPIFDLLLSDKNLPKISINFQGCLSIRLREERYDNVLSRLTRLGKEDRVEFTESSAYHAILPYLNQTQVLKQIELNRRIYKDVLDVEPIKVLFPPELYFSSELCSIIKDLGIESSLVSEYISKSINVEGDSDSHFVYDGVNLLKRDRLSSQLISLPSSLSNEDIFNSITNILTKRDVIIVLDGEIFGHHFVNRLDLLKRILYDISDNIKPISKKLLKSDSIVLNKINLSSWESILREEKLIDFRWKNSQNKIHKYQWKLYNLAQDAIEYCKLNKIPCEEIQNSLSFWSYSCQFWWAGAWPFWHPSKILEGAYGLYKTINLLPDSSDFDNYRSNALLYYSQIVKAVTEYDLKGTAKNIIREYDKYLKSELNKYEHIIHIL